jgi:hypothetical protein
VRSGDLGAHSQNATTEFLLSGSLHYIHKNSLPHYIFYPRSYFEVQTEVHSTQLPQCGNAVSCRPRAKLMLFELTLPYIFNSGPTTCTLYSLFLSSLVLRVSGAIFTHHQDHNCRVEP